MKDVKKVVSTLLRKGAVRVDNIVVKSAYVSEDGAWVVLTLNQNIPMYVQKVDDDGVVTFEKGEGNRLFVSTISVNAVLGNNPMVANLRSLIMSNDENVKDLFSYATIDIIAENVNEGDDYINPFSDSTEGRTIEHSSIYHHLINIEVGDNGEELLDTLKEAKREYQRTMALEMLRNRATNRDRSSRSSRPARPRRVEVDVDDNDEDTEDDVENTENTEVEAPARTTSRRRS